MGWMHRRPGRDVFLLASSPCSKPATPTGGEMPSCFLAVMPWEHLSYTVLYVMEPALEIWVELVFSGIKNILNTCKAWARASELDGSAVPVLSACSAGLCQQQQRDTEDGAPGASTGQSCTWVSVVLQLIFSSASMLH